MDYIFQNKAFQLCSLTLEHTLISEDTRGELEEIPTIIGPKTDLYQVNPLSGDSFDESVLHPTDSQQQEQVQQPVVEEVPETSGEAPIEDPEPATVAPSVSTADETNVPESSSEGQSEGNNDNQEQ